MFSCPRKHSKISRRPLNRFSVFVRKLKVIQHYPLAKPLGFKMPLEDWRTLQAACPVISSGSGGGSGSDHSSCCVGLATGLLAVCCLVAKVTWEWACGNAQGVALVDTRPVLLKEIP